MSKTIDPILCPTCKKYVDVAFYKMHVDGDGTNKPHEMHIINIPGMGGPEMVQSSPKGPVMLDIPYLGRLRRDAFIAWSLIMFIFGILMAGYYWHIL